MAGMKDGGQASRNGSTGEQHAPLPLSSRHLDDLRASGLSDEQIRRCGFHSLYDPSAIQTALKWTSKYKGELGPCLAIPFVDDKGQPTGYMRLKPDNPRSDKNGKPIKYESPYGSPNLPYFPPDTSSVLHNPSAPLVITEGEKKAAKADQEGFSCIGLVGVYGWQKAGSQATGGRELIDQLAALPWHNRTVHICFDSDSASNSNVRGAEKHLAEVLTRLGALTKVVRLPPGGPGPDGKPAKVGLDDFLVANGAVAFRELLKSAGNAKKSSPGKAPRQAPQPYVPFPTHLLPPIAKDFVEAQAMAIGCDPALVALPVLAVMAGSIGASRVVLLKRGWVEPSVVWGITIAESGGHKTPAWGAAVKPMVEIHMNARDDYRKKLEAYKKEVKKDSSVEEPEEPPTYVTHDATIEAVAQILNDNPHGLTLARDELDAWFQSFTRYSGGSGANNRAGWLEFHSAGPLLNRRASTALPNISIRRAAVSICGGTQPGILRDALDKKAIEAGLGARFLMAMPPRRKRIWTEAEVADELVDRYQNLLVNLQKLPMKNTVKQEAHVLGMSAAAKLIWVNFYNEWGEKQWASSGEQASAFAKVEAYASRFMLIHHVASCVAAGVDDLRPIGEKSASVAVELARWFAAESERIYAMLGESESDRDTRRLVEWIRGRGGRTTTRILQKSNNARWKDGRALEALQGLADAAIGHWEESKNTSGVTIAEFVLNPLRHFDTSDTSPFDEEDEQGMPSDTSADTSNTGPSAAGSNFNLKSDGVIVYGQSNLNGSGEVSEVSECLRGVGNPEARVNVPAPDQTCRPEVSEGGDDFEESAL